jgi:hypothetical protein
MIAMSRKCGIKFRLLTPVPLLDSLGGSQRIKDAVSAGNVVVFRTANQLSGQMAFNGVMPVEPCEIPKEWPDGETTAGLGYIFGPGAERPIKMRTLVVEDSHHWATTGTPATEDDVVGEEPEATSAQDTQTPGAEPLKVLNGGLDDDPADTVAEVRLLAWFADHGQVRATHEATTYMHTEYQVAPRTTRKALTDMVSEGLLKREKRGEYAITDQGRTADRRNRTVA